MKSHEINASTRRGLIVALSMITDVDPLDPERDRPDSDEPGTDGGEDNPSTPSEQGEHQFPDKSPDDLERRFPRNPDERREDRERGGNSPLDDMTIPKDPNGKNVG